MNTESLGDFKGFVYDFAKVRHEADKIAEYIKKSDDGDDKTSKLIEVMVNCPDCSLETIAHSLGWPIDFG